MYTIGWPAGFGSWDVSLIYNIPEEMVEGLVILVAHVLSRGGHSLSMTC